MARALQALLAKLRRRGKLGVDGAPGARTPAHEPPPERCPRTRSNSAPERLASAGERAAAAARASHASGQRASARARDESLEVAPLRRRERCAAAHEQRLGQHLALE